MKDITSPEAQISGKGGRKYGQQTAILSDSLKSFVLVAVFLLSTLTMFAQHPYGFTDGDVYSQNSDYPVTDTHNDGKLDWQDIWLDNTPPNSISTNIIFDDKGMPNDDVFDGGGSKDGNPLSFWHYKLAGSSDKSNIGQVGAILIGDYIYYFGNRIFGKGSTNIGLWFFQNDVQTANGDFVNELGAPAEHMDGDILIVVEITNGGSVGRLALYEWQGDAETGGLIQSKQIPAPDGDLFAVTNDENEKTPWSHQAKNDTPDNMPPRTFMEGFIDLAEFGVNACFSTFLVETRASFSLSSVLEDFVYGEFNVTPSVSVDDVTICEDDAPATLTAVPDGGVPPYTYYWSGPNGFSDSGTTLQSIQVSEAGEYSVYITGQGIGDSPCPSDPDTATVTFIDNPDVTADDATICEGESIDLTTLLTDADGGTVTYHASQADADAGTPELSSTTVSPPIGTITYYLRSEVTVDGVTCYGTTSIDITVVDNPDVTADDATICEGGSIDLASLVTDADGGSLSYHATQADADAGTPELSSSTVSPAIGTTTYYIRSEVTVNGTTCYGTTSVDITVTDNPDVTADDATICEGESIDLASLVTDADGGSLSYHASQADADAGTPELGSSTVSPAIGTTTYYIRSTVTVNGTTCYGTTSVDITVTDNPDVTANDATICEGESIDLASLVTDSDGGSLSYHATQADADAGTPELASSTVSPAIGTTTYYIRSEVTVNDVTCYGTTSVDITVVDDPDVTTNNATICVGDSIDLATLVTDADGGSLSYHATQADADAGTPELASSTVSPPLGTTTYYVRSEVIVNGTTCYGTAPIEITAENCVVDEGCTPGYWKNHLDAWAFTGANPDDNFFEFFGITSVGNNVQDIVGDMDQNADGNLTLLEAISAEVKTSENNGWFAALARHAVAAYLNASHPDVGYQYSTTYIIESTRQVFMTDYASISEANAAAQALHSMFREANERYCPLGNGQTLEATTLKTAEEPVKLSSETESTASASGEFSAYPVPFSQTLNIEYLFGYESDVSIQIFNLNGQLLRTYSDRGVSAGSITTLNIDFAINPDQVYIIRVVTDRDTFVKKVISSK